MTNTEIRAKIRNLIRELAKQNKPSDVAEATLRELESLGRDCNTEFASSFERMIPVWPSKKT